MKNGRKDSDYAKFQEATSIVTEVISRRKVEYQNHIALKTYWSILKTFHNGKKVPF